MKRWLVPLCLLAVLLAAHALRWETEGRQTLPGWRIDWIRDRWTGRLWMREVLMNVEGLVPVTTKGEKLEEIQEREEARRDGLTRGWQVAVGVISVWLLIELWRTSRLVPPGVGTPPGGGGPGAVP